MMLEPDKKLNIESVVLKEEQPSFLSGDNRLSGCSSLSRERERDTQLDILADIIFEQFLLETKAYDTS